MFVIDAAVLGDDAVHSHAAAANAVTEYENAARLLISLLHEPHAAAVTSDGTLLATGHDDGSLVLWNVETAVPLRHFAGHTETVSCLAFDAAGSRLASGGYDQTVRLWDVAGGAEVAVLRGHTGRLTSVAFSPDGERLASGGYDKTVRIWNLKRPEEEPVVLSGHKATVGTVAFSPAGARLAIGDQSGTLRLWGVSEAHEVASIDSHSGPLRALLFSPDGESLISGGDDGAVITWDAQTLERKPALADSLSRPLHTAPVTGMAFTPDGRMLATADRRGHVQTWDLLADKVTSQLDGHEDEVVGLAFLSGGEALITVSFDRTVNVWRSKLPVTPRLATMDDAGARLWTLAASPDELTLFAGGRDRFIAAWNLETGQQTLRFAGFEGTIDALDLTADGSHLACCGWREENVMIFDTKTGEKQGELAAGARVRCVRFSPDGERLVAGGEDGTLRIWSWRTGEKPQTISTGALAVYDVAFSPDGKQLVTCSGDWRTPEPGDVTFWNADNWSETRKLTEHSQAVRSVAFCGDGSRVASAGEDGLVILWHARTHVPVARLQNGAGVRPVAFSPDGRRLAAGLHDGTINVWDIGRGEVVQRFQSEDDVFAVSYSSDGSVLFSVSGEKRIEIWPTSGSATTADQIQRWKPQE